MSFGDGRVSTQELESITHEEMHAALSSMENIGSSKDLIQKIK